MCDEINENLSRQADEIEALFAIYEESMTVEDEDNRSYSIKLNSLSMESDAKQIVFHFQLPANYPSLAPPVYQLNAPWLRGDARLSLQNILEACYWDNCGESILFNWTEKIREFLHEQESSPESSTTNPEVDEISKSFSKNCKLLKQDNFDIEITHTEVYVDRKSKFQGHSARVHNIKEVNWVINELKQIKKIADASHNIVAYRIYCEDKKCFLQDCDDDGETHAGNRVLHLMEILDVKNVVVIVTRWYGGVLLGPDRFKHINNMAREALQLNGLVTDKVTSDKRKR